MTACIFAVFPHEMEDELESQNDILLSEGGCQLGCKKSYTWQQRSLVVKCLFIFAQAHVWLACCYWSSIISEKQQNRK